ncbi:MAG: hypothetical protein J6Y16_02140 [Treponema sp.]|nr:hypothetical protein [Treponema sp.]
MIYHYTSIETLKKIIMNKTIRLNRMDKVDDKTESESFHGIKLGKYLFVSSWTRDNDENLLLWERCAVDHTGVRIGLPEHMFKMKYVSSSMYENGIFNGIKLYGENDLLLTPEEVFTFQYEILPIFTQWDNFMIDMEYVDDVTSVKNYIEEIANSAEGTKKIVLSGNWLKKAAGVKNKIWKQQNEVRFVLIIFPSLPIINMGGYANPFLGSKNIEYKIESILRGNQLPIDYYDLSLDDNALNNIEITFGAACKDCDKQSIIELTSQCCLTPVIKNSILTGTLRK